MKNLLFIFLFSSYIYSNSCKNLAVASDDLNKKFRYGCFCGKNYPHIEHPSKKSYRALNKTQRKELILSYQKIDAYDDIDEVCKEHDICYIMYGKEAKVCNDKLYNQLNILQDKFENESDDNITAKACKNLAYDIASVFYTIFSPADDEDTIFDFGMLMFNGAVTAGNKVFQESVDTLNRDNRERYPLSGDRCSIN